MNVIVSYKQKDIIDNANIDAIKDLNGLFNVDDLIAKFKNYFFSKMILDVTSVENFTSREVLQKLVDGIGSDRLIILLPQTPPPPNEFKKMLIDLKIYNFSNDISDVVRFIDNPNTYETVMRSLDDNFYNDDNGYVDNSIKGSIDDNESQQNNNVFNSTSSLGDALNSFNIKENPNENNSNIDMNETEESNDKNDLDDVNNSEYNVDIDEEDNNSFSTPIYDNFKDFYDKSSVNDESKNGNLYDVINYGNNNKNNNNNDYLSNSNELNQSKDSYVFLNVNGLNEINNNTKKIIGFKNVTKHAGSTSLIYVILKALNNNLKKDAFAIEIGHNDFKLFMNNRMASVDENGIDEYISSRHEKIILVDLNECSNTNFCDEVVYLIEPSTIMLNRLMMENPQIFKELTNKKVILNKSMLSADDVSILSGEAGIGFMYNLGSINDRKIDDEIIKLIDVLDIK